MIIKYLDHIVDAISEKQIMQYYAMLGRNM